MYKQQNAKKSLTIIIYERPFLVNYHQSINVPTAGALTFFMDYTQGELAISHHAGPVQVSG
jgi:hypothetical protein